MARIMLLAATCFMILKIAAIINGIETEPKSVNVALETVLAFNNNDKVEFIDEFQDFLSEVKQNIVKRDQGIRKNTSYGLKFTDFMKEIIKVLKGYQDDDLEDVFAVLDDEIRKYHYKGCKFYELVSDRNVRRYVADKLELIRDQPAQVIRNKLKESLQLIENAKYDSKQSELLKYVDSLYTKEDITKLSNILDAFETYKSKTKRTDLDLVKVVKDTIRNAIFDHYSSLNINTRRDFKAKLETLIWKNANVQDDIQHLEWNLEVTEVTTEKPLLRETSTPNDGKPNEQDKNTPSEAVNLNLQMENEFIIQSAESFSSKEKKEHDIDREGHETTETNVEIQTKSTETVNVKDKHATASEENEFSGKDQSRYHTVGIINDEEVAEEDFTTKKTRHHKNKFTAIDESNEESHKSHKGKNKRHHKNKYTTSLFMEENYEEPHKSKRHRKHKFTTSIYSDENKKDSYSKSHKDRGFTSGNIGRSYKKNKKSHSDADTIYPEPLKSKHKKKKNKHKIRSTSSDMFFRQSKINKKKQNSDHEYFQSVETSSVSNKPHRDDLAHVSKMANILKATDVGSTSEQKILRAHNTDVNVKNTNNKKFSVNTRLETIYLPGDDELKLKFSAPMINDDDRRLPRTGQKTHTFDNAKISQNKNTGKKIGSYSEEKTSKSTEEKLQIHKVIEKNLSSKEQISPALNQRHTVDESGEIYDSFDRGKQVKQKPMQRFSLELSISQDSVEKSAVEDYIPSGKESTTSVETQKTTNKRKKSGETTVKPKKSEDESSEDDIISTETQLKSFIDTHNKVKKQNKNEQKTVTKDVKNDKESNYKSYESDHKGKKLSHKKHIRMTKKSKHMSRESTTLKNDESVENFSEESYKFDDKAKNMSLEKHKRVRKKIKQMSAETASLEDAKSIESSSKDSNESNDMVKYMSNEKHKRLSKKSKHMSDEETTNFKDVESFNKDSNESDNDAKNISHEKHKRLTKKTKHTSSTKNRHKSEETPLQPKEEIKQAQIKRLKTTTDHSEENTSINRNTKTSKSSSKVSASTHRSAKSENKVTTQTQSSLLKEFLNFVPREIFDNAARFIEKASKLRAANNTVDKTVTEATKTYKKYKNVNIPIKVQITGFSGGKSRRALENDTTDKLIPKENTSNQSFRRLNTIVNITPTTDISKSTYLSKNTYLSKSTYLTKSTRSFIQLADFTGPVKMDLNLLTHQVRKQALNKQINYPNQDFRKRLIGNKAKMKLLNQMYKTMYVFNITTPKTTSTIRTTASTTPEKLSTTTEATPKSADTTTTEYVSTTLLTTTELTTKKQRRKKKKRRRTTTENTSGPSVTLKTTLTTPELSSTTAEPITTSELTSTTAEPITTSELTSTTAETTSTTELTSTTAEPITTAEPTTNTPEPVSSTIMSTSTTITTNSITTESLTPLVEIITEFRRSNDDQIDISPISTLKTDAESTKQFIDNNEIDYKTVDVNFTKNFNHYDNYDANLKFRFKDYADFKATEPERENEEFLDKFGLRIKPGETENVTDSGSLMNMLALITTSQPAYFDKEAALKAEEARIALNKDMLKVYGHTVSIALDPMDTTLPGNTLFTDPFDAVGAEILIDFM